MVEAVQIIGPTQPLTKIEGTGITPDTTPVGPSSSSTPISSVEPRQIVGPGEMVTIQPSAIRTAGQSSVFAPAKRVAPMDSTQNVVKLDTGEFVGKSDFDALTTSQQVYLTKNGIAAFNAERQKGVKGSDVVKLGTGEFVGKSAFDALTPAEQAYLMKYGIDAFNVEGQKGVKAAEAAESEAQTYVQRENAKQTKFASENLITLSNGDLVAKDTYNALTPAQQVQLMALGVDKFNVWAKEQSAKPIGTTGTVGVTTTTTAQPPNTVRLNNGDFVSQAEFDKLLSNEQVRLKALGVDGYNKAIQADKDAQTSALGTLQSFAYNQLPKGFIGPPSISGSTVLAYLAANKNSPEALAIVKAAGYDITTKDSKTGKSILDLSNQVVSDRIKAAGQIQQVLATGKGTDALISAMSATGLYDNSKLNATLKSIGGTYQSLWFDNVTKMALTSQDIAQRIWNTLTPAERNRVIDAYGADVYKGNYFSEYIKEISQAASEGGILGQLIFGPLLAMGVPVAKILVGQSVSGTEWVMAGATAVVTAATLGVGGEFGGIPGLAGKAITTAAAGTLTTIGVQQTIANWGVMKTPERVVAVALDVAGVVGTVLSGVSTFKAVQQVFNIQQTTNAALKAGNAYTTMVRTLDAANAEAAEKGLVSSETVTKVQNSIDTLRAADTTFLARFGKLSDTTIKQLNRFESLSGYKGLAQGVQDLNTARNELTVAWDAVATQTDSVARVRALMDAQVARNKFFTILNQVGDITTPRTKPVPAVVWDEVIATTQTDLNGIRAEIASESKLVGRQVVKDTTRLTELQQNARILQDNIDQYVQLKQSGSWQGALTSERILIDRVLEARQTIYVLAQQLQDADVAKFGTTVTEVQGIISNAMQNLAAEFKAGVRGGTVTELGGLQVLRELFPEAIRDVERAERSLTDFYQKRSTGQILEQDFQTEFNNFIQRTGKYSPEYQAAQRLADEANANLERSFYDKNGFWPAGSGPRYGSNVGYKGPTTGGGTATATRVTTETTPTEGQTSQMALDLLVEDIVNKPTAAEPRTPTTTMQPEMVVHVPGIGTAAIPVPLLLITPIGLGSTAFAAGYIASMTPQQFTKMFGDTVKVQPMYVNAINQVASMSGMSVPMVSGAIWLSPDEAVKVAGATSVGTYVQAIIDTASQVVSQVMIATDNQIALDTARQNAIQAYIATIIDPAIRTEVIKQIERLNVTNIQPTSVTEIAPNIEIQPTVVTETKVAVAIQPVTPVTPIEPTTVPVETVTPTIPITLPPIPLISVVSTKKRKQGKIYPAGTAIWKMGFVWKVIPPPYTLLKPISTRTAPVGVSVLEGTPEETLTFIGGVVPFTDISFDLGVVDGYIDVKNMKIVFTGGGLKTKAGETIPKSLTTGISFPSTAGERARVAAEQEQTLRVPRKLHTTKIKRTVLKSISNTPLVQSGS